MFLAESAELRAIELQFWRRSTADITPRELHAAILDSIANPEPPLADGDAYIMSSYKAKGLTVNVAVVAGAIESLMPSFGRHADAVPPSELKRREEEQWRLFYVALTRPTDALVVSSFLEMPWELVQRTHRTQPASFTGLGAGRASPAVSSGRWGQSPRLPRTAATSWKR